MIIEQSKPETDSARNGNESTDAIRSSIFENGDERSSIETIVAARSSVAMTNGDHDELRLWNGDCRIDVSRSKTNGIRSDESTAIAEDSGSPNVSRYGRTRKQKLIADCFVGPGYISLRKEKSSKSPPDKPGSKRSPSKPVDSSFVNGFETKPKSSLDDLESNGLDRTKCKTYIKKDLIQRRDENTEDLMHSIFSPVKLETEHVERCAHSTCLPTTVLSTRLVNENCEYSSTKTGHIKILEFDDIKKEPSDFVFGDNNISAEVKLEPLGEENFPTDEHELSCGWKVGDLAWARVGCHPMWPCIVTRNHENGKFVNKKSRSLVASYFLHVTFFADNGKHSWLAHNFLMHFTGLDDFNKAKDAITPEMRKKDPKYCAAFHIKDIKISRWRSAVTEAEMFLRRPFEFRQDLLEGMMSLPNNHVKRKYCKKVKRETKDIIFKEKQTDVSLSESLFDKLFSSDSDADNIKINQNGENILAQNHDTSSSGIEKSVSLKKRIRKRKEEKEKNKNQRHIDQWLIKTKNTNTKDFERSSNDINAEIVNSKKLEDQSLEKSVISSNISDEIIENEHSDNLDNIFSNVRKDNTISIIKNNSLLEESILNSDTENHHSDTCELSIVENCNVSKTETDFISSTPITKHTRRSEVTLSLVNDSVKFNSDTQKHIDVANSNINITDEHYISIKDKLSSDSRYNYDDPDFQRFLSLNEDRYIDENPNMDYKDILAFIYDAWCYGLKVGVIDEKENTDSKNCVKGMVNEIESPIAKKTKKTTRNCADTNINNKNKPVRKYSIKSYLCDDYSESSSDDDFKSSKKSVGKIFKTESNDDIKENERLEAEIIDDKTNDFYMESLKKCKPNIFKGMTKEKVCEICEKPSNLLKCKGPCQGMFHRDCAQKESDLSICPETEPAKIKKKRGRKTKKSFLNTTCDDVDSQNKLCEESVDLNNDAVDNDKTDSDVPKGIDFDEFEAQMSQNINIDYNDTAISLSNKDHSWKNMQAGECVIVDSMCLVNDDELSNSENDKSGLYETFRCKICIEHDTPLCFICKLVIHSKTRSEYRQRCGVIHCNRFYHPECLKSWPQTKYIAGALTKTIKKKEAETVFCPRHVCHTCVSDDPHGCKTRFSGDKLARCVRCPATYHCFTQCIPAGTQLITASQIVCPKHFRIAGKTPNHVNTSWCFICAKGGTLICCETCPTSFHAECLNISLPEDGYICEDCETGRYPLYEELVWVKLGQYRWWPAYILHPTDIPINIRALPHHPGQFAVRFFGIYDHYWVNSGRVFLYQEGDTGHASSRKSNVDLSFLEAVKQAQKAFDIIKNYKHRGPDDEELKSSLLPPKYVKLKVNRPVGNLINTKFNNSEVSKCECDPNSEYPCAPDMDCLNRMLFTECSPNVCDAGGRCCNQAFEKRLYPRLEPSRTECKGWGLTTLQDIKKGEFVIEYVGEVIDDDEYQQRMNRRQEIRDENFYFLTLDKDRMIDAGPKGNVARFMNHSCEPNCETQKWTVNGDVRVGLFALKDIPVGSEVTFNYNFVCTGDDKKKCLCGAKKCAGFIGAKPKQEEVPKGKKMPLKRKYRKKNKNTNRAATNSTNNNNRKSLQRLRNKSSTEQTTEKKELEGIDQDVEIINNSILDLNCDTEINNGSDINLNTSIEYLSENISLDDSAFNESLNDINEEPKETNVTKRKRPSKLKRVSKKIKRTKCSNE